MGHTKKNIISKMTFNGNGPSSNHFKNSEFLQSNHPIIKIPIMKLTIILYTIISPDNLSPFGSLI
jgi:hypothetical protein